MTCPGGKRMRLLKKILIAVQLSVLSPVTRATYMHACSYSFAMLETHAHVPPDEALDQNRMPCHAVFIHRLVIYPEGSIPISMRPNMCHACLSCSCSLAVLLSLCYKTDRLVPIPPRLSRSNGYPRRLVWVITESRPGRQIYLYRRAPSCS